MASLTRISQAFEDEKLPWAVFGGAAVAWYRHPRKIRDVDILTVDSGLDRIADTLGFEINITDRFNSQKTIQMKEFEIYGNLNLRTSLGVHVFSLDAEMIARCEYKCFALIKIPLLSREDNIVLKAILQRSSEVGKDDISDIQLLRYPSSLDTRYIEYRIEICTAQGWADRLLYSMGIL